MEEGVQPRGYQRVWRRQEEVVDTLDEDDDDLWKEDPLQQPHKLEPARDRDAVSRHHQKHKISTVTPRFAIKRSDIIPRPALSVSQLLAGNTRQEACADAVESSSEDGSQPVWDEAEVPAHGFGQANPEQSHGQGPLQSNSGTGNRLELKTPRGLTGTSGRHAPHSSLLNPSLAQPSSFRTPASQQIRQAQQSVSAQPGGFSPPVSPPASTSRLQTTVDQPPLSVQRNFLASNLPPLTASAIKASATKVQIPKGGSLTEQLQAVLKCDAAPEAGGQLVVSVERSAMEGHVLKAWCSAQAVQPGCEVPGPELLVLFNTNPRLDIGPGSTVGIQPRWHVLQSADFPIVFAQHAVVLPL